MRTAKRKAAVIAEIERACDRAEKATTWLGKLGKVTVWTDARWYEVLSRDEIQAVFTARGYGPLRPTMPRVPGHEERFKGAGVPQ